MDSSAHQDERNCPGIIGATRSASQAQVHDSRVLNVQSLSASAAAAMAASEVDEETKESPYERMRLTADTRVDSAQEPYTPRLPEEPPYAVGPRLSPKLQTAIIPTMHSDFTPKAHDARDEHIAPDGEHLVSNMPAVLTDIPPEPPATTAGAAAPISPHHERLPSFQQHFGQLGQLAEAASNVQMQSPPRQYALHRQNSSFGSAGTAPSPHLPYSQLYPLSVQTSPAGNYSHPRNSAWSPAGTLGETQHYGSPTAYNPSLARQGPAFYAERSATHMLASSDQQLPHTLMPPFPASLPSAGSSGRTMDSSMGSMDDHYSTSRTTSLEQLHAPAAVMSTAVPSHAMASAGVIPAGGFQCDEQGCTAVPFQTQYLLSSHKNVHSQARPHYCPEPDCPRSEGRKGFKRKNEMIRHGLVHRSPGYVCPFCVGGGAGGKEHRYPRPDNLQRHVRVHHTDKDREDPALREVLAQRIDGSGGSTKARRRRTGGEGSIGE